MKFKNGLSHIFSLISHSNQKNYEKNSYYFIRAFYYYSVF